MPPIVKSTVIIVGAGIGGLTLAILLEQAQIPYIILKRSTDMRNLGPLLVLDPSVFPLFEQLYLLDEFMEITKPVRMGCIWNEKLEQLASISYSDTEKRYGYFPRVVSRSNLYQLLLSRVPDNKIHRGKNVKSFETLPSSSVLGGVKVQCADNSEYHGDILVGADGACSSVRQHMYKHLKEKNSTKSDTGKRNRVPPSFISIMGETRRDLKEGQYEFAKEPDATLGTVLGHNNNPYSWTVSNMHGNSICWIVTKHLKSSMHKTGGPIVESSEDASCSGRDIDVHSMIMEVRNFPVPFGKDTKTLGDLIDLTVLEDISSIMLEEKMSETWYSGRAVLLGDACHGMNPTSSKGAVLAIQDAAVLADVLFHLKNNSHEELTKAFSIYRDVRYPSIKQSFHISLQLSQLMEQTWINDLKLWLVSHMPKFVWNKVHDSMYADRPQVSFLPHVPVKGEIKLAVNKTLFEYTGRNKRGAHASAV